jgi:hypothetical protein
MRTWYVSGSWFKTNAPINTLRPLGHFESEEGTNAYDLALRAMTIAKWSPQSAITQLKQHPQLEQLLRSMRADTAFEFGIPGIITTDAFANFDSGIFHYKLSHSAPVAAITPERLAEIIKNHTAHFRAEAQEQLRQLLCLARLGPLPNVEEDQFVDRLEKALRI